MSAIKKELMEAANLKAVRGESDDDLKNRIINGIGELSDEEWDKLSPEAQDYFNDAADAANAHKPLPDFPDAVKDEKTTPRTRRGTAAPAKEEPAARVPEIGDILIVTTIRDKVVEGELVEIDGDTIILDVDGKDQEFTKDRVKSVEFKDEADGGGEAGEAGDEGTGEYEPEVDDEVTVVTKRGKTVEGKVIEVDDTILVLEVDGKEEEFQRSRLESIAKKEAAAPAARARRNAATTAAAAPAAAEKKTKVTAKANNGVSATLRMRQLICDDMKASAETISKQLKKEGLQFKDNTLTLVYADVHKILDLLRERKLLK